VIFGTLRVYSENLMPADCKNWSPIPVLSGLDVT